MTPSSPKPPNPNEPLKAESHLLRGTIAQDMADTSTGAISEPNSQLTKFHGLYLQDDRDQRIALKKAGKEKAFSFMLRVRLPGRPRHAAAMAGARRARRRCRLAFAAPDHAPDLPVSRRAQGQREEAGQGHAPGAARFDRGLRRREPQRHGAAQPGAQPGAAAGLRAREGLERIRAAQDPRLPRNLARRRTRRRRRGGASRCTARPTCRANSRPASPCRRTTTSISFRRTSASSPSSRTDKLAGYNVTVGGGLGMSHGNAETYPRLADVLGLHPRRQGQRRSARRSSPRSAITATGPTASTRGSSTRSRTAASTGSRARWKSAPASPSQPARPFEFTTHRGSARLARVRRRHLVLRPAHSQRPHQGHRRLADENRAARNRADPHRRFPADPLAKSQHLRRNRRRKSR